MAGRRQLVLELLSRDRTAPGARSVAKNLDAIADAADKTSRSADNLSSNMTDADRAGSKFGQSVQGAARDVAALDHEVAQAERELDRLARAFARADSAAERADLMKSARRQETQIRQITKVKVRLESDGAQEGVSFGSKFSAGMSRAINNNTTVILGGILATLPLLAATSGAILVGGASGMGIVGGAILAAKDPRIKAAGAALGKNMMQGLERGARPMVSPMLDAIKEVDFAWKDVGKSIDSIFLSGAANALPVVTGIVQMVRHITSGLAAAAAAAGPVMTVLGQQLPIIGQKVGDIFNGISDDAGGMSIALGGLLTMVGWWVSVLGAVVNVSAEFWSMVNKVQAALGGVDFDKIGSSATGMTVGLGLATGAMVSLGVATRAETDAAKALKTSLDALKEANLSVFDAQIAAKAAIAASTRAIKENGAATSNATAKGRENNSALSAMAHGFNNVIDAQERAGTAANKVSATYGTNKVRLIAAAEAAGYSSVKARQLANDLLKIPATKLTKIDANASGAIAGANSAKRALNSIPRHVTSYVSVVTSGNLGPSGQSASVAGKRESGGPVSKGKAYIVGERRPEVFVPETDGRIVSSVSSYRAGTGSGAVKGGGVTVNVYAHPSNNPAEVGKEVARTLDAYYRNGGRRP